MRIAVLYNQPAPGAGPDEEDVLAQVAAVSASLARLGHGVEAVPCSLDLARLEARLEASRPDLAFNLVEALAGRERLIHLVPALLDVLGQPYTGSATEAIFLTSNKVVAKERLAAAGLPTPELLAVWRGGLDDRRRPEAAGGDGRAIVKGMWDHGSVGIDEDRAVVAAAGPDLAHRLAELARRSRGPCFAEAYVEGREFNLSLLAGPDGPEVLPAAEIEFLGFPAGKPRIVGYRAKWQEDSFEYTHTPRRFAFPAADRALLERLAELARAAWRLFGLAGWARVDFRVDGEGRPTILEVNVNPCLSPDAGFAAALAEAGLTYDEAIGRIVGTAAVRP